MKPKSSSKAGAGAVQSWDAREVLPPRAQEREVFQRVESAFTARDRQRLQRMARKLDRALFEEKVELVRDTVLEIQKNRRKTANTLLQRNVWSSLDVIGMELDRVGFTDWFREAAPRLLRGIRLDDPGVVSFEHRLMLGFLGMTERQAARLGLPQAETREVLGYAEDHRHGECGELYFTGADFSFQSFFRRCCGRPTDILEIHHSPQAKGVVVIISSVLNLVSLFFAVIPLAVVTVVVSVIVGCAGC